MNWAFLVACILLVLFSFVILYGAPFLPTLRKQVGPALDLMGLEHGQTMLELGCGDGRVLRAAAERGLKSVGYELNPLLVMIARIYTWKYRNQVRIIWGNYWKKEWPQADGIFVFLLNPFMQKLDKKITQYKHKPVKLVSFAFQIPAKNVSSEKNGLYLYDYQ